ncbi:hypothetical protein KL86DPRO_20045 [uncultured delta proteobacterium]|uniref:Uncharacterized protein n=1 Tax=uncultured delta proteobacterium TaxID=34034 RepID=A0A212JTU6_9DELT|nr:hypothetical protein KL86DPRO_20045 [uncultured delta proteobacterium]
MRSLSVPPLPRTVRNRDAGLAHEQAPLDIPLLARPDAGSGLQGVGGHLLRPCPGGPARLAAERVRGEKQTPPRWTGAAFVMDSGRAGRVSGELQGKKIRAQKNQAGNRETIPEEPPAQLRLGRVHGVVHAKRFRAGFRIQFRSFDRHVEKSLVIYSLHCIFLRKCVVPHILRNNSIDVIFFYSESRPFL